MQCRRALVAAAVLAAVALLAAALLAILHKGPCSGSAFRCGNTSQCVPHHFVCNYFNDCMNGEDENLTLCANTHGLQWLENKTRQQAPRMPDYAECALWGSILNATVVCQCGNSSLTCAGVGLHAPPVLLTTESHPKRLNLNDNRIHRLKSDAFSSYGNGLRAIILKRNGLQRIAKDALHNHELLRTLDLSDNRLRTLPLSLLRGLRNLEWLFLARNCLTHLPLRIFMDLELLSWLDLSGNHLKLNGEHFPYLPALGLLDLQNNGIRRVSRELLAKLPKLSNLFLQENKISKVDPDAFKSNRHLHKLNLSYNDLYNISSLTFQPLVHLQSLNLEANPFGYIPRALLQPLRNLSSLNLEGLELEQLDLQIFDGATLPNLQMLWLHRFHFCSYAPMVKTCRPNTDGVSSAAHLLERPAQRAAVWASAAAALAGNALVLAGRGAARDDSPALSTVVKNLAAADLLMGAYLCAVGACDRALRGVYAQNALRWMASWECATAGAAAMLSSEVSVLLLLFLSLERFLLIAVPFGAPGGLSTRTARRVLAAIWVLGAALAIIPAIHWRHSNHFYGTNGLCFPLHIEDPFMHGWQYSAFVVLGVNIPGLLAMAALYACVGASVWRTRRAGGAWRPARATGAAKTARELQVAARVLLLVAADAACWVPVAALKIIALARGHVPADMYAWVVVFVLPVNSALNPMLYTFATPRYRRRITRLWSRARALCKGGGGGGANGAEGGERGGDAAADDQGRRPPHRRTSTHDTDLSTQRAAARRSDDPPPNIGAVHGSGIAETVA